MTQLQTEIELLKNEMNNMWDLVRTQLVKAKTSLVNFDKNLAREVISKEKRVNAYELKIDRDCEDIFALYTPVAIDLRFLLAVLKINTNLERTGDIAEGVAKYVLNAEKAFSPEILKATKVIEMFEEAIKMFDEATVAFDKEDPSLARNVFAKDEFLDDINKKANHLVMDYLKEYPNELDMALYVLSIIRKLERVGDQSKNVAEEIIFYVEAKVVKHSNKL